jgi:hypothetical protein
MAQAQKISGVRRGKVHQERSPLVWVPIGLLIFIILLAVALSKFQGHA